MDSKKRVCHIGVGSNLGDRLQNIRWARKEISARVGRLLRMSSVLETEPWGMPKRTPMFLNQVLEVQTELTPERILQVLKEIEGEMGKKPRGKSDVYENRPIDLDVLLIEQNVIHQSNFTVPHPGIEYREFVLKNLCELIPNALHPKLNLEFQTLYRTLLKL